MGLKEIWGFLWNSDSIWSWIADFALAFLLVRFVFFPLMSLLLGSSLPLVVVESGSMEHNGDFDSWWQEKGQWYIDHNITKAQFEAYPMKNGFNKGDIILTKGIDTPQRGDVIIFKTVMQTTPIIHRIINQNEDLTFATKGDHNTYQIPYEISIKSANIVSKAIFRIPYLGWLKLFFVELLA